MKWKDFKEMVERNGVKDEDEIRYIDCHPLTGAKFELQKSRLDHDVWVIWT
jgi:hypothetical protein